MQKEITPVTQTTVDMFDEHKRREELDRLDEERDRLGEELDRLAWNAYCSHYEECQAAKRSADQAKNAVVMAKNQRVAAVPDRLRANYGSEFPSLGSRK